MSTIPESKTGGAGIWIDHRKAVIVSERAEGEQIATLHSHVEKHLQRSGDRPLQGPFEAVQVPADNKRQRALTAHLNVYYDAVIDQTRMCPCLYIFGPGEAKGELTRRLRQANEASRIAAVETADRLTERQIAAKVREFFDLQDK